MKVIVGLLVRNRAWVLPRTLERLAGQDYPLHGVIAIVNNSDDESLDLIERWFAPGKRTVVQVNHTQRGDFYLPTQEDIGSGLPKGITGKRSLVGGRNVGHSDTEELRKLCQCGSKKPFIQCCYQWRGVSYLEYAQMRNLLLDEFLKTDGDALWSIDSDILASPSTLRRLLYHGADLVSALICNDSYGETFNIMRELAGVYRHFVPIEESPGLLPVDMTGACTLLNRKVIESGVRYGYHDQGEDIYFCEEARKKLFQPYMDSSVRCAHALSQDRLAEIMEEEELQRRAEALQRSLVTA